MQFKSSQLTRCFYFFLFLNLLLWSILPVFIRHSIDNDLIEALTWGHQFQWGYDKNPFLPALLAHTGGLFGFNGFGIYFTQQLFIFLGIWSVRALTFELTHNAIYAFIAATSLLLCTAYNLDVQIYNDNYILQGLLPLSALFFYRGIKSNSLRHWIYSAIILGFATLAKYSAIIFLPLYAIYLLCFANYRTYFLTFKPYFALLIYLLILLPNFIWLNQQGFNALYYAFFSRGLFHQLDFSKYLILNLDFLFNFLILLLPSLMGFLIALEYKKNNIEPLIASKNTFQRIEARWYSYLLGFGPILLLFLLASLIGFSLHREWSSTFLSFVPMALLAFFQPTISQLSLTRFILFTLIIMICLAVGYVIVSKEKDVSIYPGPEIARSATQLWHRHFNTKLAYVAGDRYTAGYIGYYSKDKPAVWMEWNIKKSPWINLNDLRCKGALFVIENGHTVQHFIKGTQFPAFIRQQFPKLNYLPIKTFPWYRNRKKTAPLLVKFALLPPDQSFCKPTIN